MQTIGCSAFAACKLLALHTQSVLLPCKETSLLRHHPLGAGRNMTPPLGWATSWQHLVSLPPNWKQERQMWAESKAHFSPPVCSGILIP